MSENQSILPDSNSTPPLSGVPLESLNTQSTSGIEKRQILSPVSPHPVHIAENSTIPVLKNQMDSSQLFNHAADDPKSPTYNIQGLAVVSQSPSSLGSLLQNQQHSGQSISSLLTHNSIHQQQHQSQLQFQPQQDSSSVASYNSASAILANSTYPSLENSSLDENGDIAADNGTHVSLSVQTTGSTNSKPSNTLSGNPNPTLPNNLPSNVDLQALLTKLSPASPTFNATPHTPPRQNGTPTVITSNNAIGGGGASVVQSPSAQAPPTQSPVTKARIAPNPPPPPPNHPLPAVPVVSSSVPGHPAAGYPASLPPPPFKAAPTTDDEDDEDSRPFTIDEEEEFSRFLTDERDYVTQGQWDRFPPGSRLFIGNLPTEKVTKRDLFRIFHKHGRLAQVSIKQAYGFVQFLDQTSCASALRNEQGSSVRGRKMHLEISKPQRNTRPTPVDSTRQRRSRSPEYARGSTSPRRGAPSYRGIGTNGPREVDRYRGPPADRDTRDRGRERDEYGSRRRSPPLRARDDYRPGRRSRSRSPPARYRPRSRSPDSDDVPLPRRAPGQVPEVQILVSDELDRNFIWWVEQAFRQRGATCDMLFLNPRLQLSAVVKRQVLEGVQAVVFLNRQMQQASKISIQIFDRRGDGDASFDQYDNLDPPIAAELVIRAKQSLQQHQHQQQLAQVSPVTQFGGYGAPPPVQQAAAPVATPQSLQNLGALASVPGLANLLGTLDPSSLQKLISGLQNQQPIPQQNPYQIQPPQQPQMPQLRADLATLLAGASGTRPAPANPQPPQVAQYGAGINAFGGSAGLAALLGQAQQKVASLPHQGQQQHQQVQQAAPQPGAGQIGNIMETLAKWKQS